MTQRMEILGKRFRGNWIPGTVYLIDYFDLYALRFSFSPVSASNRPQIVHCAPDHPIEAVGPLSNAHFRFFLCQ